MRCTIVFDLDGTLLNTLEDIARAANAALVDFNPALASFSLSEIRSMIGDGARALLHKMLLARGVVDSDDGALLDKAHHLFELHYSAVLCRDTRAYDSVIEGLRRLHRENDVTMCICTNKPHELAVRLVRETALAEFFSPADLLCTGAKPLVKKKPSADHVLHAIAQALSIGGGDIAKTAVLVVGDGRNDILVAQAVAATMKSESIAVTYGFGDEDELVALHPTHVAHSFAQATEQILDWVRRQQE